MLVWMLGWVIGCGPKDDASVERCDGVDNDGDGVVDNGFDRDADGFLAADAGCGALGLPLDCDDGKAEINPAQTDDTCDGVDDDCSGEADDDADLDGDGARCTRDCDEEDPDVHVGALEACDGADNNCDGRVDEDWDEDGDGAAPCSGDCNERDPLQGPNQPEICDGTDNNCDGTTDEGFDLDADGQATCEGDCDDTHATVYAGAVEICDDLDNDCNGETPDRTDSDADGYTICDGDCAEDEPRAHPGGVEACDAVDNDCDGATDDKPECFDCTVVDNLWVCGDNQEWTEAVGTCADLGATLAIVTDADTDQLILDNIAGSTKYWIGLSDTELEGTFRWVDGSDATWFAWADGNPTGRAESSDCVWVSSAGWSDNRCTSNAGFVCAF